MNDQTTPAWMDLLPQADDIAFYQEHGWWQSPVVLPQATLAQLRAAQDDFYENGRQIEWSDLPDGWQRGVHREDMLRKNDYTSLTNPVFMDQLIKHPYIGAAAAALEGVDVIRLWHDQLLYKPGRSATDAAGGGAASGRLAYRPKLLEGVYWPDDYGLGSIY